MAGISGNLQSHSSFSLVAAGLLSMVFCSHVLALPLLSKLILNRCHLYREWGPLPVAMLPERVSPSLLAAWARAVEPGTERVFRCRGRFPREPPSRGHGGRADWQMRGPAHPRHAPRFLCRCPQETRAWPHTNNQGVSALVSVPAPPPLSVSSVRDPLSCWGARGQY